MRSVHLLLLGAALAQVACGPSAPPEPSPSPAPAPAATSAASTGSSTQPAIQMSPVIPSDVSFGNTVDLPALQKDFDIFSWNSFIALSWPPGANPDQKPGAGPTGDNPTAWEDFTSVADIFLPGGKAPSQGAPPQIPAACRDLYKPGMKVIQQIGKTPGLLDEFSEPFNTGPLVDQNGNYARFEILVNQPMFDYILGNSLYSQAGQKAFTGTVKFPCGGGAQEGAIMVKAAWKILGANDDRSRFHTSQALIYTPASANPPVQTSCSLQTVGLVGFHVGHKVQSAPQWVWSTFEQVDNVPDEQAVKSAKLAAHYNFYSAACKDCPVNTPPPQPWIPNQPGPPSQVVRAAILPDFALASAAAQNRTAKGLFTQVNPKSVWQFYELVSTQWPTNPGPGNCTAAAADPNGTPAPNFLANTTLETYVQGTTPNVSSSCIGCHGNAAMTTGAASDFTYILERAQ